MLTLLKDLRSRFQNDERLLRDLSNLMIRLYPTKNSCIICGQKTNLLKTSSKNCYSIFFGKFTLIEGFYYCVNHKYEADNSNKILKYHSELAMEIVDRRHMIAIDLMVKIGLLRYREHRQLEEIHAFLKCSSAKIDLPISTIGMISKRFLEYCKLFHQKYEYKIKKDIKANGGAVVHYDGATEKGCGVINFIVKDSLSGHILASEMIKTENYVDVVRILRKVKFKFGIPLATVSDLKNCFKSASEDAFDKKAIHKSCDYHFLRTFGDDFIKEHSFIKARLNKSWKIISSLRKQLKIVEQVINRNKPVYKSFKDIEQYWEDTKNILETHRLVLTWIIKFKQASSGKGVPFDLPYLDLYERLNQGKKLIDTIFTEGDITIKKYCLNFNTLINRIHNCPQWGSDFKQKIKFLKFSRKWFTKLRGALLLGSLQDKEDPLAPLSKKYQLTEEEAKTIPINIEKFLIKIEKEISLCKKPDRIKILKRFRDQTNKHKDNLKSPMFVLTKAGVLTTIIPSRTNNCVETFFRLVKALIRRNTGRSALTKEFASIGALLPFFVYMKDHKTFKSLFENEEKLIEEFATITRDKWDVPANVIHFDKKLSRNTEASVEILEAMGRI